MTNDASETSSATPTDSCDMPYDNPAIARCIDAWNKAYNEAMEEDQEDESSAQSAAAEAYRNAMPPLMGARNIREFIACTAHGILIEAIRSSDATRLLYAAQVAAGAHRAKSKNKKTHPEPSSPASVPYSNPAPEPQPLNKQ